jgi:GT2 family glycosyltransferase
MDAQVIGRNSPLFSVVVPTFERPTHLTALMERLEQQTCGDFEVIVVDQSARPWGDLTRQWRLRLRYYHTDITGAVNARNKGAFLARGELIAFVDDDCLPALDWLESASKYFRDSSVVGVEGLIVSDKQNDPAFRAVTNANLRGLGFMTANLFMRRETFHQLDGFDPVFDKPHFREDTDFGWRALEVGEIPFAEDVVVFHPPHPRSLSRESREARTKFFEKDALLFEKHPDRYKELFLAESHWKNTPGFWEHFLRGHEKYGIKLDPFFVDISKRGAGANR